MPTVDQLVPAIVAADDDVLPVSQSGTLRRVTRSQLLAGTQASLALTPGLLGRVSAGLGPPQAVTIGSGLSLSNGILSGAAQFSTAALPVAGGVGLTDLVPVSQGAGDHAVSVRALYYLPMVSISLAKSLTCDGGRRAPASGIGLVTLPPSRHSERLAMASRMTASHFRWRLPVVGRFY